MARNVKTISVCLPGYLRMWVRKEAEERGLSVSAYVTMALTGVYREHERVYRPDMDCRREVESNGTESAEVEPGPD